MTKWLNHGIRITAMKNRKLYMFLESNNLPTSVVLTRKDFLFFLFLMYLMFSFLFIHSWWSYFTLIDRIPFLR